MPWKYCAPRVHHRRFPFNQNFRNFRNSGKWYRNFPEKFQKSGKRLNFRNANHSTEISGNFHVQSCTEKKLPGKFFRKFEYTRRGCPLLWKFLKMLVYSQLEVPENSTTGMNRGFGGMKSAPYFLSKLVVFLSFEICQFHLISYPDLTLFFPLAVGDLGTRLNFTLTRRWKINTENFLDVNKKTVSTF